MYEILPIVPLRLRNVLLQVSRLNPEKQEVPLARMTPKEQRIGTHKRFSRLDWTSSYLTRKVEVGGVRGRGPIYLATDKEYS